MSDRHPSNFKSLAMTVFKKEDILNNENYRLARIKKFTVLWKRVFALLIRL